MNIYVIRENDGRSQDPLCERLYYPSQKNIFKEFFLLDNEFIDASLTLRLYYFIMTITSNSLNEHTPVEL